ncbi:SusC/RagA family TonB-linked outer membrane protein [Polaribacter sp. MSW13]|uniref:SusC/RagA family TonB-linked outer membrane protein n=1 Tax=Polaribacter marinus TaxID=2916838 RepID=A0A9X1VQ55_9FLAO|nr:SusC/RagA family TonB-linked outer membrane protein [Polaribacter marinus]MCI2229778.1 SusC/RagA family TonB-linked outer membrane protein [Polaribacter marinus]
MKTKFKGILTLLLAFLVQITFAQEKTVSGIVSDSSGTLPGVSVVIKGTKKGTQTDFDGKYSIKAKQGDILSFSYIGYKTIEKKVDGSNTINVAMEEDASVLDEIVVTALGMKREAKTLSYASQSVKGADLNLTQSTNIKSSLAGKVAGVQIVGQAGSKLGQAGKIRIRGAISLTQDNDPLYVVDGVPTDPNNIDMDNVESLTVLKGPNATSLYGQRADAGVIVITTKAGKSGLGVEFTSSATYQKVAYLPNYQNLYGGGDAGEASFGIFDYNGGNGPYGAYDPSYAALDGARHLLWDSNYDDVSWGPKYDDQPYAPWYTWFPGTADNPNPYYGKQVSYSAQPNNIKDFYDTGMVLKNIVSIYGGDDKFNARLSFTDVNQNGITPYTSLKKQYISTKFNYDVSDKFKVGVNVNFTKSDVLGDYDDGYGNQTSGSFNSWFHRDINVKVLKELKDLQTPDGYSASWNWWGPNYSTLGGSYKKPAFWFNPYTFMERYKRTAKNEDLVGSINLTYELDDHFTVSAIASRSQNNYARRFEFPYSLSYSAAPDLYNDWINSFGIYNRSTYENNYSSSITYKNDYGDIDVEAFIGGNIRKNGYDRASTDMVPGSKTGGLIIPDLYTFSNAAILPATQTYTYRKHVKSIYGKVSLGYKDFLYLDASYRKDWSSSLPSNNNGYGYPSVGSSFIFTKLMEDKSVLSFGKFRAGWAQVGNDVAALRIEPTYPTSDKPYGDLSLMYTSATLIDPNIKPAINTALEAGVDLKFLGNRFGFSATYYKENRKDEIIPISISSATGTTEYLTNAGETQRTGLELSFDAAIFKTEDFNWIARLNWATNKTTVESLPADLQEMEAPGGSSAFTFVTMTHQLGNNWGQLKGAGIKRDANGNKIINSNGTYAVEQGQYLGSVLPDFTGGFVNTFSYKGFTLNAAIDFQKGGKFFSLSEMWGANSGLTEETAAINDKGFNVRDDIASGGGVHVTGVDASGAAVDTYVDAPTYFAQWYSNRLAEPFIHDASFIKLREVSLSYTFPKTAFGNQNIVDNVVISLVGRNLGLLYLSKDNKHGWDPSELSQTYGESGQLPGTRSFGMNVKVTF